MRASRVAAPASDGASAATRPAARASRARASGATVLVRSSQAGISAATPIACVLRVRAADRVLEPMRQAGRRVREVDPHQRRGVGGLGQGAAPSSGARYALGTDSSSRGRAVPARWMTRSLAAREADVSTAWAIASKPEPAMTDGGAPTIRSGSTSASRAATPGPADAALPAAGAMEDDRRVADLRAAPRGGRQRDDRQAAGLDPLAAEQGIEPLGRRLQGGRLREVDDAAAADGDDRVRAGPIEPPDEIEDGGVVGLARRTARDRRSRRPASAREARTSALRPCGPRTSRNVTSTVRGPTPAATAPDGRGGRRARTGSASGA